MAKPKAKSRSTRWSEAASAAREALDNIDLTDLNAALEDLKNLQAEYQEWYDNLPDNLQYSSMGEKLENIINLDFDVEIDANAVDSAIQEAENADLPLGFGRD